MPSMQFMGWHPEEVIQCELDSVDAAYTAPEVAQSIMDTIRARAKQRMLTIGKITHPVSHPAHYTAHPSGIECIQVTEHMSFCLGNAMKYIWRAGDKGNQIQDLEKAVWYIKREIARLSR